MGVLLRHEIVSACRIQHSSRLGSPTANHERFLSQTNVHMVSVNRFLGLVLRETVANLQQALRGISLLLHHLYVPHCRRVSYSPNPMKPNPEPSSPTLFPYCHSTLPNQDSERALLRAAPRVSPVQQDGLFTLRHTQLESVPPLTNSTPTFRQTRLVSVVISHAANLALPASTLPRELAVRLSLNEVRAGCFIHRERASDGHGRSVTTLPPLQFYTYMQTQCNVQCSGTIARRNLDMCQHGVFCSWFSA